jgi:hypothetical protein
MENHDTGSKGSTDVVFVDEVADKKPTVSPDLSAEIVMTIDRQKGEKVKCRRIFGDNYRVNWMAVDERAGQRGLSLALDTYRIRQSKFLRVKKVGERLVIEDITSSAN